MAEAAVLEQIETEQLYRFVDDIPGVAEARQGERRIAELILEQRRNSNPRNASVELLPVDALSTAHSVLDAEAIYGADSPEYNERRQGLLQDCQRLVGEWYRKLRPEYFAPTRHRFDEDTQEFFSHGLSVAQMTQNALVPLRNDHEEEQRRVNEFVEEKTPQILRSLGAVALGTESIRTISQCPDTAISRYEEDMAAGRPNRGYWGYVPDIQKIMIRDIRLDEVTNDRFEEQLAIPGTYYRYGVLEEALKKAGVEASDKDKTDLHGSQLLVRDSLFDFQRLLDDVATEQWYTRANGQVIFMGELVPEDHPRDYEQFKQEALERQESLKDLAEITATFILDLAEDNFDGRKAPAHVEEFVKVLLLDEAKKDRVVALTMFDEKTADGLQEVAYLESIGAYEQASERMQEVQRSAPGGGFCGAGSCGLEGVNLLSEDGKSLSRKLDASAGDKLVKDSERSCKNCGAKKLAYAYNSKKVHTYCEGCDTLVKKTN